MASPPRLSFAVSTTKAKSAGPTFTSPDSSAASTSSVSTPGSKSSASSAGSQKMYPLFNKQNSSLNAPTKVLAFSAPPASLFSEVNRHWSSVPEGNRWPDRMLHVSKSGHYSAIANNTNQKRHSSSSFQYGGCIASIFNEVSKCAKESGRDPSGLGRWAYVRVRGGHKPALLERFGGGFCLPAQPTKFGRVDGMGTTSTVFQQDRPTKN